MAHDHFAVVQLQLSGALGGLQPIAVLAQNQLHGAGRSHKEPVHRITLHDLCSWETFAQLCMYSDPTEDVDDHNCPDIFLCRSDAEVFMSCSFAPHKRARLQVLCTNGKWLCLWAFQPPGGSNLSSSSISQSQWSSIVGLDSIHDDQISLSLTFGCFCYHDFLAGGTDSK